MYVFVSSSTRTWRKQRPLSNTDSRVKLKINMMGEKERRKREEEKERGAESIKSRTDGRCPPDFSNSILAPSLFFSYNSYHYSNTATAINHTVSEKKRSFAIFSNTSAQQFGCIYDLGRIHTYLFASITWDSVISIRT